MLASRKPVETVRARIAPLALLPVFLDLANRRAVVAGGGAAAAWKAELLAAAGAKVDVLAAAPCEELVALAARDAIRLVHRAWEAADFAGAAVAIGEAASETDAAAFQAAARTAGTPCCVIDRPGYGDFTFGSIVNRGPVVIGVSTAGAAPVLAQAIRRRIEGLLPAHLGDWAALARAIRARVKALLPDLSLRRSFWEGFADRAFAEPLPENCSAIVDGLLSGPRAPGRVAGSVTLVGAGPGDPGLLTLNAVRALQSADIVLHDDLVSDEVLELARREAKRVLVGKRVGRPSCRQDEINALMLKLARQGRRVVRLKSGDPMVFGRAGEEIAMLAQHGVAASVIPGITAGLAMAALFGVSLTHRERAHSVRFVTGHSRKGGLPADLDWKGLADPETTTIVYMGGRTAPALARRLIGEGLDPATPVVAAANLSRPGERRWTGRLAELRDSAVLTGLEGPILLGIGQAFAACLGAENCAEEAVPRSAAVA